MKSTKTTKTQNEVLNTAMDIDFAMEQEPAKKVEKKATAKTEKKAESKKPVAKKDEKKAPAKKEEKAPAPKAKSGKGKNKPLVFDSVTPAAQYLADLLGLKITNAKDCLYKALRGKGQTHKFNVSKNEANKIVLTPIA